MARPKKPISCPYVDKYCDFKMPGGEMMCLKCYNAIMKNEFKSEFEKAEEYDILAKE